MRILVFLIIFLVCMSCVTTKKSQHYDSVFKDDHYSSKKDIVDTLRDVANLDKDDFAFISDRMKNVVESYKALQVKVSNLEKKIDRLLTNRPLDNLNQPNADVQILTEEISDDTLHFGDENSKEEPLLDKANTDWKEKRANNSNPIKEKNKKLNKNNSQKTDKEARSFIEAKRLYSEKSWESAISKFQDYIDKNPKGLYAIEATYYIGESFVHLKMLPEARIFYGQIVQTYPKSTWALKAKQKLKNK